MEELVRSLAMQMVAPGDLKHIGPNDSTRGRDGETIVAGKVNHESVCYADPGPYPFLCGRCANYRGDDEAGPCEVVWGPQEREGVSASGSCDMWRPGDAMVAPPPIPEVEGGIDSDS